MPALLGAMPSMAVMSRSALGRSSEKARSIASVLSVSARRQFWLPWRAPGAYSQAGWVSR